jgi:signal transduction histidine kinase
VNLPTAGRSLSLRAKFLLIVLAGGILPLAFVGVWLADGVKRSGEAILAARLDSSLSRAARDVGESWVRRRSTLLSIVEDSALRHALATGVRSPRIALPLRRAAFADLHEAADFVMIHDARSPVWVLDADSSGVPTLVPAAESLRVAPGRTTAITIWLSILAPDGDTEVGRVEARLRIGALIPSLSSGAALAGAVFAVVDRTTGAAVVPLPFELDRMRERRFDWSGEQWLAASRVLEEPAMELLGAAPTTAYTAPFAAAGRRGLAALAVVGLAALIITLVLTRRVTGSLVRLAAAADAVRAGDLSPRVELESTDEVGRMARAFNGMIESLRRMLRERSEREAVTAVGEFAASLAHEIRNPLSTVRLNLQHVQEQLPASAPVHGAVTRALGDIDRLNRTVGGVLRMARSGSLALAPVDLRQVLEGVIASARADVERSGVVLQWSADEPLPMVGNAAALEQMFLNLLLNAIQATAPRGRVGFDAEVGDGTITVTVWDEGRGFDEGGVEKAFEPFYSTKPEGTGLGLTVARRIAVAHSGSITVSSAPGKGTRVLVSLPGSAGKGRGERSGPTSAS